MDIKVIGSLSEIDAESWNALHDGRYPFSRFEFLIALEEHHAVGERYGWHPQYLLAYNNSNLVGAVPMYIKDNSYGEFVFDWAWADAYHRAGLRYYPKLVVAIPYTPATGPRILIKSGENSTSIAQTLITAATEHAQSLDVSSLHWLFTNQHDTPLFDDDHRYMLRLGCQFHWQNNKYKSFDDYLSYLTSKKRKQIKRERRLVKEQGVELEVLHGDQMSDEHWHIYHRFYCSTFERKSGMPTLSLGFFQQLGESMPENVVVVMAKYQGDYVASAFNIKGADTLYGRHWGCNRDFANLHFEACYYQGLEYCIDHQLQYFEPGAQGEHKISRGFLPTATWSAHWLADPQFRQAIGHYLEHETEGMEHYIKELVAHSPFKTDAL